ncbi:MAG TPA: hypothetical protein VGI99_12935, partial [Gemmataceae bacterium]
MFRSPAASFRTLFARRSRPIRRSVRLKPEQLEARLVPATITWDISAAPTGGNWETGSNWIGGTTPGANDDAVIALTSAGTVATTANDTVHSVSISNKTTLSISGGSLTVGVGTSNWQTPVIVAPAGTLNISAGAHVAISDADTVTINGTLNVTSAGSFTLDDVDDDTNAGGIVVNGIMNTTNTTFSRFSGHNGNDVSRILVNSGGHLTATNSVFQWDQVFLANGTIINSGDVAGNGFDTTIFTPAIDIPLLTNNLRFQDVVLNSGSATGTTLDLNPLGTSTTANQRYVFNGSFAIQAGTTVNFNAGDSVLIDDAVQVTVNGTLNLTSATVSLNDVDDDTNAGGFFVSGTMSALNSNFIRFNGNNGNDASTLQVNSGG